ncbi:MAG: hypothetical protein PWQ57_3141 [Desulfovibrionales bacterium]|nr:hypothetical protein [Desulfovibrionales bacterium]
MRYFRTKLSYKLTIVLFLFAMLVSASSAALFYYAANKKVTQDIRHRLKDIVASASFAVDVESHDLLREPADEQSDAYRRIKRVLQRLRDASSDIHFIYTMRKGPTGDIRFVVDAETDPAAVAHLGDSYDEPSDLLAARFANLDEPLVEETTYTDEFGAWLSGYAPFFRPDGTRAGVIGVDISAQTLGAYHQSLILLALALLALTAPLIFIGGFLLSSRLVRPIVTMKRVAEQFGQGDFDARVEVQTEDELGQLGRSLNDMATKLKMSYDNIRDIANKYRAIFNNALEGIFQATTDGELLTANRAMLDLLGYGEADEANVLEEQFVGDVAEHMFADPNDWRSLVERLRKGPVKDFSARLKRKDESIVWCEMNVLLQRKEGGADVVEGLVQDVTERLERNAALLAREKAQAASRAKSVFLDNSGQGFLSFGKDHIIDPEYSKECSRLFAGTVAGARVDELLMPDDAEGRAHFAKGVKFILNELDPFRRDLFISLMPGEFVLGEAHVKAEYKVTGTGNIMMILTDVTTQKRLQREARREHERLKLVVSSVRDARDFFEVTGDFERFSQERKEGDVQSEGGRSSDFYREVHTYKGLFSQMDFIHTPEALHDLESTLARIQQSVGNEQTGNLASKIEDCHRAFLQDLEIIRNNLGDEYLDSGRRVFVSLDQAKELGKLGKDLLALGDTLPDALAERVAPLLDMGRESLRGMLVQYPRAVERLARQRGKEVLPFEVEGDDILVDPERFSPLVHALAHVFRNAVDHGVETPEERFESGKPEFGAITCSVTREGDEAVIEITDDGRGVDVDALRANSVRNSILTAKQAERMSREEALNLAFAMGLSSKTEADGLSGRGVGLSALQAAVNGLGGSVQLQSEQGRGSRVIVRAPVDRIRAS